jgi:hypothetical protein
MEKAMDAYLAALDEMEALYAEAQAEKERQERRHQLIRERTQGRDEGRREAEQMLSRVQAPQMREAVRYGVASLLDAWIPAANRAVQNFAREIATHAENVEMRVPALRSSWDEEIDYREAVLTVQMTIPDFHQRVRVMARNR